MKIFKQKKMILMDKSLSDAERGELFFAYMNICDGITPPEIKHERVKYSLEILQADSITELQKMNNERAKKWYINNKERVIERRNIKNEIMKKTKKKTSDYVKVIENYDCKEFSSSKFLEENPKATISEITEFLKINGCYGKK
jgi:hypothetical protein